MTSLDTEQRPAYDADDNASKKTSTIIIAAGVTSIVISALGIVLVLVAALADDIDDDAEDVLWPVGWTFAVLGCVAFLTVVGTRIWLERSALQTQQQQQQQRERQENSINESRSARREKGASAAAGGGADVIRQSGFEMQSAKPDKEVAYEYHEVTSKNEWREKDQEMPLPESPTAYLDMSMSKATGKELAKSADEDVVPSAPNIYQNHTSNYGVENLYEIPK
ncbi:PREDICTED: uncharacterized protein LOC106818522 [Priapulus caudatus]|uniref:Uncharacterized protein LOC106818522 n=1 Tax=Priapulus caudatus TaxID=37621 RepID=A0ABM1F2N7_PRICU|nr:PREDICTED: uncharacterized protein LOC106818522 [Priapulus caudatus]XP_014678708.1 PREDICTED: uncharacterized protein LOC106818522 [Priapulus caudatus]XP_014678709.1 PREDICTED: uncharacterized protein LOC106818522 [Priapulus caudatus]XP_014678710.1 PREDICTED: uncharacterized protein LOC106818522 [Priapulus caudatus]